MTHYATASEVKAYSGLSEIQSLTDLDLDTKYIPRAQRLIDSYCRQNFRRSPLKIVNVDGSGSNRQELRERLVSLTRLRFIDGGEHTAQANGVANLDFINAAHWSVSDDTKVEVDGGQANLINDVPNTITYPFTTPANYTHGGDVEVTGGVAQLVSTPFPSDGVLFAPFTLGKDAAWGDGSLTGTLFGGATVVAGKLVAEGILNRGVYYEDPSIGAIANVGALRFLFTPNYNGSPAANQNVISLTPPTGAFNKLMLFHSSSGTLRITANDSVNASIHSAAIIGAVWVPVSGTEYEFEINFNATTGVIEIYIDGVLQGATPANSYTRGTTATRIHAGADASTYQLSNGKYDNVLLFDAVQHTAGYTPGSFPVESNYVKTNPTITTDDGLVFDRTLDILTMLATEPGSDSVTFILSSDDGVTFKYWNGSTWVGSDNSLAQSNDIATALANLPALASSGTFKLRLVLHSDDGSTTPTVDIVAVANNNLYPTDDNLYLTTLNGGQITPSNFLSWVRILFTTVIPTNTDIKVLLSIDNRLTWCAWDGLNWSAVADPTLRANATDLVTTTNNFPALDADTPFDIRIFLFTSDVLVTPEIADIRIESMTLSANSIVNSIDIDRIFNKNWWLMADAEPVRARQRIGKQEHLEDSLIFPLGFNNIELTGIFGYSTPPPEVKDATAEVVERIVINESSKTVKHGAFLKEKIGDYSYEKMKPSDGNTRDGYISEVAKDFLRKFRKPILISRI